LRTNNFDPITLNILWERMIAIAEEVGTTLIRTAFSVVLRENGDWSVGLFDARGSMLAQTTNSATGHIGATPYVAKTYLKVFPPETLQPGDVIITNDPWIGCGHSNDVYIASPVFRGERLVGMVVTSAHQQDIGGRLASTESREVYEEGIRLPVMKLYNAGVPNSDIFQMIEANVRFSDMVLGDIRAQVAATYVGAQRMLETMTEYNLESLEGLADEIIGRTEASMRASIQKLPDGIYSHEEYVEETDRQGRHLKVQFTIEVKGDEIIVDYTGTSPQISR